MLGASFVINFYAAIYSATRASNSVTDIVLSNIPVYDVDGTFIYGPMIFWTFIITFCITEPKRAPFVLKSIALFILIRSIFISLTHIGPDPTQIEISSSIIRKFSSGADLFFSAHTGLPFLMALVFWNHKVVRILSVLTAIFFGIVVLAGHLHYSIDVVSAFFITYSIFRLAEIFFPKDRVLLSDGIQT